MSALSPRTDQAIELLFEPDARTRVRKILEKECGTEALGCSGKTPEEMERIRFAVLKLGMKNATDFDDAVSLAKADWRDLLIAAGFGEDLEAHKKWWRSNIC